MNGMSGPDDHSAGFNPCGKDSESKVGETHSRESERCVQFEGAEFVG
jgi:hypothetical protein